MVGVAHDVRVRRECIISMQAQTCLFLQRLVGQSHTGQRMSKMGSNRGGARPGAGRPRLKVVKVPDKPRAKYLIASIYESFWQEFCEAASDSIQPLGSEITEADYERLAEMVLVDAMHRYIRSKKKTKK